MTISPTSKKLLPWCFLLMAGLSIWLATVTFDQAEKRWQMALTLVGISAAFIHFLYSRHLEETRTFSMLFTRFNERYDALNNRLNEIVMRPASHLLSEEDKRLIFDYFNLCAEEYYFYRSGFIPEDVWHSWRKGMQGFLATRSILDLLKSELGSDSYYGLTLEEIKKGPRVRS